MSKRSVLRAEKRAQKENTPEKIAERAAAKAAAEAERLEYEKAVREERRQICLDAVSHQMGQYTHVRDAVRYMLTGKSELGIWHGGAPIAVEGKYLPCTFNASVKIHRFFAASVLAEKLADLIAKLFRAGNSLSEVNSVGVDEYIEAHLDKNTGHFWTQPFSKHYSANTADENLEFLTSAIKKREELNLSDEEFAVLEDFTSEYAICVPLNERAQKGFRDIAVGHFCQDGAFLPQRADKERQEKVKDEFEQLRLSIVEEYRQARQQKMGFIAK